jgi:hypothetical protein
MSRDGHRLIGAALILAAVLALLVLNRVTGPGVRGRAFALPALPPPAAGSCLLHSGAFDAADVPCDRQHTAEVIRSWPAARVPAVNGEAWRAACPTGMTTPSTDLGATNWTATAPPVATSILRGGGPVLGWAACARYPSPAFRPDLALRYRGTLVPDERGMVTARVGTCLLAGGQQIDCTLPHPVERLGEFRAVAGRRPVDSCAQFARRTVGSNGVFGSAGLVAVQGRDTSRRPAGDTDERSGDSDPVSTCDVHVAAGRALVGSVVGLGGAPLPFG